MRFRPVLWVVLGLFLACLAMIVFYNLPPVHQRLAWRVAGWQAQVRRALNPPEQRVFVPQGQAEPVAIGDRRRSHLAGAARDEPRRRLALPVSQPAQRHPRAFDDARANRNRHPAADAHSGESRPERYRARVPAVQQLWPGQPGDGAVLLGLAGRPARYTRLTCAPISRWMTKMSCPPRWWLSSSNLPG